jgi:hypothetical protein
LVSAQQKQQQTPVDLLSGFLLFTHAFALLLACPLGIGVAGCARTWARSGASTRTRAGTAAATGSAATTAVATAITTSVTAAGGEQHASWQGDAEADDKPQCIAPVHDCTSC